jgi:hypothetical protein
MFFPWPSLYEFLCILIRLVRDHLPQGTLSDHICSFKPGLATTGSHSSNPPHSSVCAPVSVGTHWSFMWTNNRKQSSQDHSSFLGNDSSPGTANRHSWWKVWHVLWTPWCLVKKGGVDDCEVTSRGAARDLNLGFCSKRPQVTLYPTHQSSW